MTRLESWKTSTSLSRWKVRSGISVELLARNVGFRIRISDATIGQDTVESENCGILNTSSFNRVLVATGEKFSTPLLRLYKRGLPDEAGARVADGADGAGQW